MSIENKVCLLIKCQCGVRKTRLSELTGAEILDSGTGFFVTDQFIITAQHVLGDDTRDPIFVVINDMLFPISIEKQSAGYEDDVYLDYALISSTTTSLNSFGVSFREPKKGEKLLCFGFSRKFKGKVLSSRSFSGGEFHLNELAGSCFENPALVTKYGNDFNNGFIMFYEEPVTKFPHGMSGGPIVNENLELRGLLSLGWGNEPNITGCQGLYLYRPLLWLKE
jgi:hypothetical protein